MRLFLLCLLNLFVAASAHAQNATPLTVPEKAVTQLEKLRRQTEAAVVIGAHKANLPAESRPIINRVLLQSATDFLTLTSRKPTREQYLACLDKNLGRLVLLMPEATDRQQVAEYFQDILDIVGMESSEGRLDAFVAGVRGTN